MRMNMHVGKTSILSTLDFIEDGRADIYKWGETRLSKRQGIRGQLYQFKKLFIDKSILKSFLHNMTVIVLLQMVLAALGTFMCQKLELDFDVHMSIFVSPIVFPLAFSINADFQRRERVLEDLAQFKGALVVLFFCHRDWLQSSGLGKDFLKTLNHKLKGLILNIKEFLLTEKVMRRNFILTVIYEDLSDISQLNDKMRTSTLPHNSPLITRLVHYHNLMCDAFERLRVIREYRSPRTIRSFTKVFIFLMPIVLSPYYVHMGIKSGNTWSPYYIAVLTSFIFGTLQGVQDVLDDPFDGISEDDINLGHLDDWTAQSLITNRTITVGRFTVTTSVKGKEATDLEDSGSDNESPPKRVQPVRVPRRRPILRKAGSHRRVEHRETNPDRFHRQMTLFPETASRLEDMERHGLTGSTTILPGMKMKRSNSDSLTMNSSSASLASQFLNAQEVVDRGREPDVKKQVWFSSHVRGLSQDEQGHDNHVFVGPVSEPSPHSRPSWLLDENEPLIAPDSVSETGSISQITPELPPKDLSQDLYDGLKNCPGTSLIGGRSTAAKNRSNPPATLADLFQPNETANKSDRSPSPPSSHAPSGPLSRENLFTPPQETPSSVGVPCPSLPSVLPISPSVRVNCPNLSRLKNPTLPVTPMSRSAPSSPQRNRWDTGFRSSCPMTPSPENAVQTPLSSVSGMSSHSNLLDQNESAVRPSGSSRFDVLSPVNANSADTSTQPAQTPVDSEHCQAREDSKVSKPTDKQASRFRISPSRDADGTKEDDPRVTSDVKNCGLTDPSPDMSSSVPPSESPTVPPSRFSVNKPRTILPQSEPPSCDKPVQGRRLIGQPSVDDTLSIVNDTSEVYI